MKPLTFTPTEAKFLAALAVLGFVVPNGIFVYCLVARPALLPAALANPLALVFMLEAFFLMFLFAWLIRKAGLTRTSGFWFVVLSLVGSLAFSVPAWLWLNRSRNR